MFFTCKNFVFRFYVGKKFSLQEMVVVGVRGVEGLAFPLSPFPTALSPNVSYYCTFLLTFHFCILVFLKKKLFLYKVSQKLTYSETVVRRYSVSKLFWKIS